MLFRVLQGVGGGGLVPSEQAILADTFPPEQRGLGFAVYGMAVVIAPAIGPTIGGWITDNYSWHWIFFINVPIGMLSLFLTARLVEDPPYLARERQKLIDAKAGIDYTGFALIALGVGALQMVLDKGQEVDWFASNLIVVGSVFAAVTLVSWAIWEWRHEHPVVNLRLFKGRNFAAAMLFTFTLGMVLNGTTVLLPQFLQSMLGYNATMAGEALAGGGFIMLVMMPMSGYLVSRVDPRHDDGGGLCDHRRRALFHGDASEPGDRFPDGRAHAHLSDIGARVHLSAVEHAGVRGHSPRAEQPGVGDERIRAEHRRQHRHCAPQHDSSPASASRIRTRS